MALLTASSLEALRTSRPSVALLAASVEGLRQLLALPNTGKALAVCFVDLEGLFQLGICVMFTKNGTLVITVF